GFALVTGALDGELVGYACGVTLGADTPWWRGLCRPVAGEAARETGDRPFAVNEIMVRTPWRRQGVASRLHDALLAARPEERAALLVDPSNVPARTAYPRGGGG